ncbi:PAS domain S-box protein [Desulfobacterium sp. N47]|uniref:histidine kinase n=1 Tax=uncultured Desulfobacterium sp. TaxID=201089 RepID=E1YGZ4_9BACT|nr:hypothetical protein N47_F15330 [uncultured Desulfobacterium sp.]
MKNKSTEITISENSTTVRSSSSDTLRTASDSVSDIIFQVDARGLIVFINDSVKLYGYQPEELSKENILGLVCDDDKEKTSEYINNIVNGIINNESIEIGLLTKDKKRVDFKLFCTIVNMPSDSKNKSRDILMRIHGIAIDISNIKKTAKDQAYRYMFQNLIDLTRSSCHELSQPITILMGYSEMMLSNMETNNPLYNKLLEINKQADKTDEIIRRMHKKIKYITEDDFSGNDIIGKI